ncbi:hypothetical protein DYB30_008698 [Aphanomyces astaci]|uniref:Uncharacterized protein n=1 Tax=Aphanomyces astaci TaxID=112090 RepID=A0A397DZB1_APHAT|nr:hypothetical protein DYB30_008698 [Aphanomyces astaci]
MEEKARLYQWTRYIAVLTTKLAALRGDLRTCHITIQQLLEQQQPHIQYLAVQIQAKAATLLQNLHSKYTQQLSDENQKWQQRYDSDLDQLGRQYAHDVALLKHSHDTELLQRERDDELEAVKVKMDGHLRNVQLLEKELEFVSNGRAKDVEELKKCHVIDKQLQLDTFQAAIGHVQTQLSDENLRFAALCQALTRIARQVAQPHDEDWAVTILAESAVPKFKKAVQKWMDEIIQRILANQNAAIAAATRPLQDEVAQHILRDKSTSELAMPLVPNMAEELAAAKLTIERLTVSCNHLQDLVTTATQEKGQLERTCDQLENDKLELRTYLDLADTARQTAQVDFSTQLQHAFNQSEETLHQVKEKQWKEDIQALVRRNHTLAKAARDEVRF